MTDRNDLSEGDGPPPGCPPLAWPDLPDDEARFAWYRAVLAAYPMLWPNRKKELPVPEAKLSALEARLGCSLPPVLRRYHKELGMTELAEKLCEVEGKWARIAPLAEAYPGIVDRASTPEELEEARPLIAFGDYLGNGNMFCFHRQTGEVYYFDHDSGAMLTRSFDSVTDYLDALMILTLAEIHDEAGEDLLVQRFGRDLVDKWHY